MLHIPLTHSPTQPPSLLPHSFSSLSFSTHSLFLPSLSSLLSLIPPSLTFFLKLISPHPPKPIVVTFTFPFCSTFLSLSLTHSASNKEALAVAQASGADFIRAEGYVFSHVADEGWMDSCAGELLRYRKLIDAENVMIFSDVKKKHS